MKIQYGDENKMSIPRRALGAEAEFTSAKAVNRGTKCSSDENVIGREGQPHKNLDSTNSNS